MIGIVEKVFKKTNKCSVLIGSVRYKIEDEYIEKIPLLQDIYNIVQVLNEMGTELWLENENILKHLQMKVEKNLGTMVDRYIVDNNFKKEIYMNYLVDNIEKDSLLLSLYIDKNRQKNGVF